MRSDPFTPGSRRTFPRRTPRIEGGAGAPLALRPLAISGTVRDALARGGPTVLAEFRRGASLALQGTDDVVFMSGPGIGLFPAHVVVRAGDLGRALGAMRDGRSLTIDVDGVRVFRTALAPGDCGESRSDRARANLAAAREWLRGRPTALGLGATAAELLAPAGRWRDLMFALQSGVRSAQSALRALIGLGAGSTPAGDDVTIGALAYGWATHGRNAPAVAALRLMIPELRALTTSLGATYLRAAAQGEFGSHLVAWARALSRASPPRAHALAMRVAQHGATSGCDTLAGFVAAADADDAAAYGGVK